jgi:hypothetical protein
VGASADPLVVAQYVATLKPTEQAKYWQYMMDSLGFVQTLPGKYGPMMGDDPQSVLNRYKYYENMYYAVKDAYPQLAYKSDATWVNPFTTYVKSLKQDASAQVNAVFESIDRLSTEIDAAYAEKNWKAYDALTAQRSNLYNVAAAFRDHFLGQLPDLTKYYEDLHAATIYDAVGNKALAENERRQALMDRAHAVAAQKSGVAAPGLAPYVLTSEQTQFLHMPQSVQRAYVANLVDALDMPAGKLPYDVKQYVKETTGLHKLFWDYLTPVQQSILEAFYPDQIDSWKYQSEFYLRGPGEPTAANHFKGALLSAIPSDLQYASAMLGKYDKRGGQSAPASYAEYLRLPHSAAVKAEFLTKHPEVAAWLSAGPLGNMSPETRAWVTNTLVKYGNFTGVGHGRGGKSWYGIHPAGATKGYNGVPGPQGSGYADIKWAKYQLFAWSRRGNMKAPATYDLWLNMPSGQAKALYLEQHPEIGQWLRLGPMANMPPEYQAIVRSIMQQYGDWTAQQNPLGNTITAFYATPQYAKQQFLANHPELSAYWAETRTPAENAMFNLETQYFRIRDVGVKKLFLAEHPELQQHFLAARTNRYNKFLNQVAAYMGANPAMFDEYLKEQNDILAELLRRYAQPNLIRELAPRSVVGGTTTDEAGSRGRDVQRPRRNRQQESAA